MNPPAVPGSFRKLLAIVKGIILNVSAYAEPMEDLQLGELTFPTPSSTLFKVPAQGERGAEPSRY